MLGLTAMQIAACYLFDSFQLLQIPNTVAARTVLLPDLNLSRDLRAIVLFCTNPPCGRVPTGDTQQSA